MSFIAQGCKINNGRKPHDDDDDEYYSEFPFHRDDEQEAEGDAPMEEDEQFLMIKNDIAISPVEPNFLGDSPPPSTSSQNPQQLPPLSATNSIITAISEDAHVEEDPEKTVVRTEWRSVLVAGLLAFCGAVQFSLYMASMWPFLQTVYPSATEGLFGLIVAVYNVGQILASPVVGWLQGRLSGPGHFRALLFVCSAFMFAGNCVYTSVETFPVGGRALALALARFLTGIGFSNVTLLKTYAATETSSEDRPKAITIVTFGVAVGIMIGPAFQLLLAPIGHPGPSFFPTFLHFSMYTAPAYGACVMNLLCAVLICTALKDPKRSHQFTAAETGNGESSGDDEQQLAGEEEEEEETMIENYGENGAETEKREPEHGNEIPPEERLLRDTDCENTIETAVDSWRIPVLPLAICFGTRFANMMVMANIETINTPLAMAMFAWSRSTAVHLISAATTAMCAIGFATFVGYMWVVFRRPNWVNSRLNCVFGLAVLVLFHMLTFSYPFLPGHLTVYNSSAVLISESRGQWTEERLGCNATRFTWCDDVRLVNPWLYFGAYAICIGFCFLLLNVALDTVFVGIVGKQKQGLFQGWMQTFGAVSRIVGPILISLIYTEWGPQWAWVFDTVPLFVILAFWLVFYRRMVH